MQAAKNYYISEGSSLVAPANPKKNEKTLTPPIRKKRDKIKIE